MQKFLSTLPKTSSFAGLGQTITTSRPIIFDELTLFALGIIEIWTNSRLAENIDHAWRGKARWFEKTLSHVLLFLWVFFLYVFPDIVLFYVMFAGGGIAVSVLEMENVYDVQFSTYVRSCGFARTVLFQGSKQERVSWFTWRCSEPAYPCGTVIIDHLFKEIHFLEPSKVSNFIFPFFTFCF